MLFNSIVTCYLTVFKIMTQYTPKTVYFLRWTQMFRYVFYSLVISICFTLQSLMMLSCKTILKRLSYLNNYYYFYLKDSHKKYIHVMKTYKYIYIHNV